MMTAIILHIFLSSKVQQLEIRKIEKSYEKEQKIKLFKIFPSFLIRSKF